MKVLCRYATERSKNDGSRRTDGGMKSHCEGSRLLRPDEKNNQGCVRRAKRSQCHYLKHLVSTIDAFGWKREWCDMEKPMMVMMVVVMVVVMMVAWEVEEKEAG